MDDAWRKHPGRIARFLVLGAALLAIGCGGGPQTGDVIPDAPGQEEGEKASMEAMERMMNEGTMQ